MKSYQNHLDSEILAAVLRSQEKVKVDEKHAIALVTGLSGMPKRFQGVRFFTFLHCAQLLAGYLAKLFTHTFMKGIWILSVHIAAI